MRADGLLPLYRDGDTVIIRAKEDGSALEIQDNHEPDSKAATSEKPLLDADVA